MIHNQHRIGNFTSSEIYKLLSKDKSGSGFGKPALTYIQECNYERKLGSSIDSEIGSRPIKWGNALEGFVFENILDTSYRLSSHETILHPEFDYWSGSPDGLHFTGSGLAVIDIKCPWTLKSFCQLSECETAEQLREVDKVGEKYYWQLVSNAILLSKVSEQEVNKAELIVFVPYGDQFQSLQDYVNDLGEHPSKYGFIFFSDGDDIPMLKRESLFKSPHIISFDIPQSDKDLLTDTVVRASKYLITVNAKSIIKS